MTVQTRPVNKTTTIVALLVLAAAWASIPTYFTYREFVYSRFGRVVEAKVIHRAGGGRSGSRTPQPVLNVEYSYHDDTGQPQHGSDVLPSSSDVQKGQTIKIEYVPGSNRPSRVVGNKRSMATLWWIIGTMAAFFGGMALLIWRLPTATLTLPIPTPIPKTLPPASLTKSERTIWWIVCAVGAVLVTISLLGGFGIGGIVVAPIVLLALGVLVTFERQALADRRHAHALKSLADELRWEFAPDGNEKLHQGLSRFHLSSRGASSVLTNLMYGRCDGTDVALFEYEWIQGKQRVRQTVVWMQRRGTRMTEFALRPENVWRQLGGWPAHGDINFESHPEFSRSYLLRGDDESAIRELFASDVLVFYERHLGVVTEGSGNKLLYYRDGVIVKPENIRSFLDEALAVRALFLPTSDV